MPYWDRYRANVEANVLTVDQVASLLQMSAYTVRELARKGELPGRKVGREWRFLRSDIFARLRDPMVEQVLETPERVYRPNNSKEDEDLDWLDADVGGPLPEYDWGPEGPPQVKPVCYIRGRGLIIEGGRGSGGK